MGSGERRATALMCISVDRLRAINEAVTYAGGDDVLVEVGLDGGRAHGREGGLGLDFVGVFFVDDVAAQAHAFIADVHAVGSGDHLEYFARVLVAERAAYADLLDTFAHGAP